MTLEAETVSKQAMAYSGGWLDRASALRSSEAWLESTSARPDTRVIPMWRDRCLVTGDPPSPVTLSGPKGSALLAAARDGACQRVFLGLDAGAGVFAADLSSLDEARAVAIAGASRAVDVRALVGALDAREAALQAYARGILHWHRHQRFCGTCGAETEDRNGGHMRTCSRAGCARQLFTRIEPAVIVLIERRESPGAERRCLLARHKGAGEGSYSTLAGFVEVGESLEDAVRREVAEEAGVALEGIAYQASQAWPFPAGLMIGFRAQAASDAAKPGEDEIEEVRWFTRADLVSHAAAGHRLGREDSIDRFLLRSWLEETSP